MAISIFFMDKLFYGKSIAVFIVMILMGGAVYFAMSFFNRPFSKWERDMINSGLGRALWVF
jgi:flagellar motor switch protein FliM